MAKRGQRVFGQPVIIFIERFFARVDFIPMNPALAAVGFLNRRI